MELKPGDRVKFIGCNILQREACSLAARSPLVVDVEFLPKGLHDLPTTDMLGRLQDAVNAADKAGCYKAILLGYARCNDGLVGLRAGSIPLMIPKAHDCITLFFGGRAAYRAYFDAHPGSYYHTTGWIERDDPNVPGQLGIMDELGLSDSFETLVEKYGRENAEFIRDSLGDWRDNYSTLCYLEMGVVNETAFIEHSRQYAKDNNWTFEHRSGDLSLLQRLFSGHGDDDFLIVRPGEAIVARNDAEVLGAEKAK